MRLRTEDLEIVFAVVSEGSESKAALILFTSQQTLSRQIKSLEARLGALLFERSARGMEPTDACQLLIPYAEACTALLREAEAVLKGERPPRLMGPERPL